MKRIESFDFLKVSKLIRFMSKISFDFYLIHFVVVLFYTKYVSILEKLIEYKLDRKINVLSIFFITIIGCLIWNMLEITSKKLKNIFYKKR